MTILFCEDIPAQISLLNGSASITLNTISEGDFKWVLKLAFEHNLCNIMLFNVY